MVTTAADPQGRPTVVELVPGRARVFPVGRLDTDTEGLLLLTNDGDLAHRLTHPRFGVEKEYLAEVEGEPDAGRRCAGCARASSSTTASPRRPRCRSSRPTCCASRSTRAATARSGACARRSAIPCAGWCAPGSARSPTGRSRRGSGGRSTLDEVRALERGGHRVGPALDVASTAVPAAVRALRGATTVDDDTAEHVSERVQALVEAMLERNGVDNDDLISILFTATDDIHSMFPATAARAVGLGDVPLHLRPGARHRRRHAALHPGADAPHHRAARDRAAPRLPRGRQGLRDDLPDVSRRPRRAGVVGTGLIGGSIGLALRRAGLARHRRTTATSRPAARALELGALDAVGRRPRRRDHLRRHAGVGRSPPRRGAALGRRRAS